MSTAAWADPELPPQAVPDQVFGVLSLPDHCVNAPRVQSAALLDSVRCLARRKTPLDAAAYLQTAARLNHVDVERGEPARYLASLYLKLGLPEAAAVLARAAARDWTQLDRDRFNLRLARAWLRYGRVDEAVQTLWAVGEPADTELRSDWQSLLALTLMERGDYTAAAQALEDRQGFPRRDLIGHYNYAVALVHAGRRAEGRALLDEVGLAEVDVPDFQAIRDRANLQLGWSWLRVRQGGSARPIFKRIALDGLHADSALLGLGWAELAPGGRPQTASFSRTLYCPDIEAPPVNTRLALFYTRHASNCRPGRPYPFRMIHEFAYDPSAPGNNRHLSALKYWSELAARDYASPAVQEGLLAVGYAYAQFGAFEQAQAAYLRALERYQSEQQRLDQLQRALAYGSNDPLQVVAAHGFGGYFDRLRASRQFDLAAADWQTLDAYTGRLTIMRQRLISLDNAPAARLAALRQRRQELAERVAVARSESRERLREMLLMESGRARQQLSRYRAAAESALLGLYERTEPVR